MRRPPAPLVLPVLHYPVRGGLPWALWPDQLESWTVQFPQIAVIEECRVALAWVEANPGKRKTSRGMPRFLVSWLLRATRDRRAARPSRGTAPTGLPWTCPHEPRCDIPKRCRAKVLAVREGLTYLEAFRRLDAQESR